MFIPGGKEMVQVEVFDERLNSSSLLDLFLAHDSGDFSRSSFDTGNEGMTEFSFLKSVKFV